MVKTGECYYRDEAGNLCLAESFVDEAGDVSTQVTIVDPV
jgi:hypothetical protein